MRINKYIAAAGVCSRRKADELILAGQVKVNGAVMKEPGYDVGEGDTVAVSGKVIEGSEKLVYYALNKPVGFVTTTDDEHGRPTAVSLLTDVTERVYPVGRLDYQTSGLLICTNDGSLSYHISHPSQKVWKTYIAVIDGAIESWEISKLERGVEIDGYTTKPAKLEILKQAAHRTTVQIQISEGRNRQIRKMFKAVGYNVVELQRTAIGQLHLGHLHEGTYRKLTPKEIDYLKHC